MNIIKKAVAAVKNAIKKLNLNRAAIDSVSMSPFATGTQPKPSGDIDPAQVDGYEGVSVLPFGHRYVSSVLAYGRVKYAEPFCYPYYDRPWFISAQTGAGKTNFVFNTIYRICKDWKRGMLVLASRSALKTKIKYDAIDAAETDQRQTLTREGIEREHTFGDADVFSYQDLGVGDQYRANRAYLEKNMAKYGAVVFDEIHFAVADADFNVHTQASLRFIADLAARHKIPRIYLTATPDHVSDEIYHLEKNLWDRYAPTIQISDYFGSHWGKIPFAFDYFLFQRDYRYVSVVPFHGDKELIGRIKDLDGVKWIIFISSKKKGYELLAHITNTGRSAFLLTGDALHPEDGGPRDEETAKLVNRLADDETFDYDILITTKCIDVGINVKDKNVNIVNYLTDKVDFLQAIGRKRVTSNETVYLYLPEYTAQNVKSWISWTERKIEAFSRNCENYPEGALANGVDIPMPIYVEAGRYRHNQFAFTKLNCQLEEYQSMLDEIENADEPDSVVIRRHQMAWLGLEDTYVEPEDELGEEIQFTVGKYIGTDLKEEEYELFLQELGDVVGDPRVDQRTERGNMKTQTVNKILKPYRYRVVRTNKKKTAGYRIVAIQDGEEG